MELFLSSPYGYILWLAGTFLVIGSLLVISYFIVTLASRSPLLSKAVNKRFLLIMIGALLFADWTTTTVAVSLLGISYEANPFMNGLVHDHANQWLFFHIKITIPFLLLTRIGIIGQQHMRIKKLLIDVRIFLVALVLLFVGVIANNLIPLVAYAELVR